MAKIPKDKSKKSSGGCGLIGFAVIWTLFSSVFLFFGLKSLYQGLSHSQWPEVPCEVSYFSIQDSNPHTDPPFQPKVRYQYNWENTSYTSETVWLNKEGVDDYEDLSELVEQERNGNLTTCYINPDAPSESVLLNDNSNIWVSIIPTLLGGLFMAIGIGLIFLGRSEGKKKSPSLSSKSRKKEKKANVILIPFFSLFALIGFGILIFLILPTANKYFASKNWHETPAKVIWSTVRSHESSDSTTYSVDIFYSYEFNSKSYRSNTGKCISGSSSGSSPKQEEVKAHPKGKEFVCYVNPEKPWQAVRDRSLSWGILLTLIPLFFIAVGLGGLFSTLKKRRQAQISSNPYRSKSTQTNSSSFQQRKKYPRGYAEFTPRGKRIKALILTFVFTAFWCGITSVFAFQVVQSWLRDNPPWFLTIFIIPFVLVGICCVLYCLHQFLGIFSPAPVIKLKPATISVNGNAKISWNVHGGIGRIRDFAIYLVGEEEATFRRGTRTTTATEAFYEEELFKTNDPRKISRGSAEIDLSQLTGTIMPSWKSSNNCIRWSLYIIGDLPFWPDIKDKYEIEIHPVDLDQ